MKDTVVICPFEVPMALAYRMPLLRDFLLSAGMKDTVVTDPIKFQQQGGTELAPMSTTENKVHTPCSLVATRAVTWFDQFASSSGYVPGRFGQFIE